METDTRMTDGDKREAPDSREESSNVAKQSRANLITELVEEVCANIGT